MNKILLLLISFGFLYALDGVKNIPLNTMDFDEVQKNVSKRLEKVDLKNLASNPDYKRHLKNIETLKSDLRELMMSQKSLMELESEYKDVVNEYNSAESRYNKKMDKVYSKNRHIKRVSYYLISHKLDQEYMPSLKNFLIDHDSIEKFDQKTEIKESSHGIVSYKNTVTTNKYFGQMQVETLKDVTLRDKDLNVKLVKVIQTPFVKSGSSDFTKSFKKDIDKFDESLNLEVYKVTGVDDVKTNYLSKQSLGIDEQNQVLAALTENIDTKKSNKIYNESTKKIRTTLKKITQEHDRYIKRLNELSIKIDSLSSTLEDKKEKLSQKLESVDKLAKYYSISINLDELEKLVIITPKLYSEHVALGEERDFVLRKTRSYLSKISVSQVQQSETLSASYDISTTNLNKTKLVEYESIHIFPFVKGKELAALIFGVIELEDKVSSEDYITKELKYASLEFVPVKKGFKTIFASTTEISLGVVKEFLETNKQRKYFDSYCIDDSTLPDEAKDFANVSEEYYGYPAVCFQLERIDEFLAWLSEKVGKKIEFPSADDWSYVASNSNSSDYCWGNDTLEELNLDEARPENIYYENGEDTYLQPIKKFKKSKLGMYDMCGNIHEFVIESGQLMIKGNSYISYIENSNAPAQEFSSDLNTMTGIRAFYTENK